MIEVQTTGRSSEEHDDGLSSTEMEDWAQAPKWYLDSARNTHVACGRSVFDKYEPFDRAKQKSITGFAYGYSTKPKCIGSVELKRVLRYLIGTAAKGIV